MLHVDCLQRVGVVRLVTLIGSITIVTGCSDPAIDGRPPTYVTLGRVLVDGEPVEGATVTFQPVDQPEGKPGFAMTDADGNFSAQTFDPGDGLTAGKHRVAVSKKAVVNRRTGEPVEEIREPGDVKEINLVPPKYGTFQSSGLEIQVDADENELAPFELVGKQAT